MIDMSGIIENTLRRIRLDGSIGRAIKGNLLPFVLVMVLCISLSGCGRKDSAEQIAADAALNAQSVSEESAGASSTFEFELDTGGAEPGSEASAEYGKDSAAELGSQATSGSGKNNATDSGNNNMSEADAASGYADAKNSAFSDGTSAKEPVPDEGGSYTTKEDVALYIHTYGRLPSNFITKKQAKKLGWSGGGLEEFAPGKCIGGDYFGNYEGLLPEDREYRECDIDTLGKSKRGAKRIIYSDDGYIYYTDDHYESFELLYEP